MEPKIQAYADADLSDCGSGTTMEDIKEKKDQFHGTGFIILKREEQAHKVMVERFVSRLSSCGYEAQVEDIYRNTFSTVMGEARFQSFRVYSGAVEKKCGVDRGNEVSAWFGASVSEIHDVLDHGFCCSALNGVFGHGIHLSPTEKPLNSLLSATPEASRLRYMLLCRVLLGKSEVIPPGSNQRSPSSGDFDSGVDSLSSPTVYYVWSSYMNTHILPEVLIIFKASRSNGCIRSAPQMPFPTAPRMPFPTLIRELSRFLPCDAVELIARIHGEYKKQKMSRTEMVERVRIIAGDRLLLEIMKSDRGKQTLLHCP